MDNERPRGGPAMSETLTTISVSRIRAGARVQVDVIGALLMREIHTRYGRDNVGYIWMFLEPMLLATGVALLHTGAAGHGGGIDPVAFSICGYSIFIMFRGMVTRAEGTLEANSPLLYHRSITIFDMMFARAILEGAGTFVTYAILIGFATVIGRAEFPARPDQVLLSVFLMFWFSFAVSTLIVSLTHENPLAGRLVHPACYLLMPASGAFFMLEWMPQPYRTWFSYFPLVDIFELLRYGQFEAAKDTYTYVNYIVFWNLFLSYFGIIALIKVRRRVHLR